MQLVLSLFPGADLLGLAFEQTGFCVVRGPDILLGGDTRNFEIPPNKFDGIIGGPPCKVFSKALKGNDSTVGNLIPEFARLVEQGKPKWWLMENVVGASGPNLYPTYRHVLNAHDFGCNQIRVRAFWSNLDLKVEKILSEQKTISPWPTVVATEYKYGGSVRDQRRAGRKVGRRMTLEEVNEAMGLPTNFSTPALTMDMQYEVRGNGVPLQLGRAVAKAIARQII